MNKHSFSCPAAAFTLLIAMLAPAKGQSTTHHDIAEQRLTNFLGELHQPDEKECLLVQSEHMLATDKDIAARTTVERTYVRISDPAGKKERLILGMRTIVDDEVVKYERWQQQLRLGNKVHQVLFGGTHNQRTLTTEELEKSGTQRLPVLNSLAMCVSPSQLLFHEKGTVEYAHQMLSGGDILTATASKEKTEGTWVLGISRKGCVKMTFDPASGYSPVEVRFVRRAADKSGDRASDFDSVTSDARIKWKKIHGKWRPWAAEFSQFQPARLTKDIEHSTLRFTYLFDSKLIDGLLQDEDVDQLTDPVKITKGLIWRVGEVGDNQP